MTDTAQRKPFVPYPTPGECIAAGVVLPLLAIAAVVLRFYARTSRGNRIGMDDLLVVPALIIVILMGASMIAGAKVRALGYPMPADITPHDAMYGNTSAREINHQIRFALILGMIVAHGFIKSSIVLFYRRVLVASSNSLFSIMTWILLGLSIAWTITFFFLLLFICGTNIPNIWASRFVYSHQCYSNMEREKAFMLSEVVINFLLFITPLPIVWRLQMPWRRKLAITGIFLLALLAVVCSIIRVGTILRSAAAGKNANIWYDELLIVTTLCHWSSIEADLALIACCLPTLKTLINTKGLSSTFAVVRSKLSLGSSQNSNEKSYGSNDSRRPVVRSQRVKSPGLYSEVDGDVDVEELGADEQRRGGGWGGKERVVSMDEELGSPGKNFQGKGRIVVRREVSVEEGFA